MKVTVIPIIVGTLSTVPNELVKELDDLGIREQSGNHPNYSIIKMG